jgi:class 3 adenylate cyclase/tetratricopeptide (TPR) repeat protein
MPVCGACDAANPDGFRYCGGCGSPLAAANCEGCGAANPPGQPFCGHCGRKLGSGGGLAGAPPAVEERKLATVLFADVVGFTSLAERTDHEEVARMVDTAFRRLAEVVEAHGGTVDKYMGDSLMALFGVPLSHDDDAERAVAAAFAIRELGGDLAFSIGINSGEVMATAMAGGPDLTVIGDAVNVAARLEKVARAGEVLCGALTVELTGDRVEYRSREATLLKGKAQPVPVFEAIALRPKEFDPMVEGPPLVGREDELAFLLAHWRRVCRDRTANFVLLCGDAGSGKTMLVSELARQVAGEADVVRAVYPRYGPAGGGRVAAALARQVGPIDDPEIAARVRSITGKLDPSLRGLDPASLRREQIWAFDRLLQDRAAAKPLLIILDDLHHGSEQTLEFLGELALRMVKGPVLVVAVGRTEPGEWLSRFPSATTVRLSPIGPNEAGELVEAFVPEKPLAPEALEFLVDRAGGNPLYIRELVQVARDSGALVDEGDHYRLAGYPAVPATLHALLAARLDALEPVQKLVLQHVALLGEPATPARVVGLGAPDAEAVLGSLVDERLVRRGRDGRVEIADSLLGEVAYETLPHNVRGELHRRAAEDAETVDDRARHLEHASAYLPDDAELSSTAAAALAAAGGELAAASRHLDALALFERAVARGFRHPQALFELARIQSQCGKEEEALATLALVADDPDEPAVAVERDHAMANTKTFVEPGWAVPRLEAVAERWRELGDRRKEAWAWANAGVANFYLSRLDLAAVRLERALGLFEEEGDRNGAVATSTFLCLVCPADPRVPGWLEGALDLADTTGDRSKQLTALATLAWHHFFRSFCGAPSDMGDADAFALRLAELAVELGAGDMAVHGYGLLAIMARFTGRLDEAATHITALQRLAGDVRHADPWLGIAAGFSVAVASGAGDAAAPLPPEDSPDPVISMARLVVEAELTLAGRVAEALERWDGGPVPTLGPISDLAGLLHGVAYVLAGDADAARPWLVRARDAARELDAQPIAVGASAMLAELSRDAGDLPTSAAAAPPAPAQSVSELLVLRARAVCGDAPAADELRRSSKSLAMVGLAAGFED